MKAKDSHRHLCPEDPLDSKVFFDQVLKDLRIDMNSSENQLKLTWKMITGEQIGSMSRCENIKNGTVYVECTHPASAAGIRMNSRELIKKINSVFPDLNINKIRVRVC
ncbi:MAG: DUF721 domain-containing protein [Sphaerochaetaceae bacterium]|nr:DUF721 domain-containing protein [Sphaerochaetaceae bacterium]